MRRATSQTSLDWLLDSGVDSLLGISSGVEKKIMERALVALSIDRFAFRASLNPLRACLFSPTGLMIRHTSAILRPVTNENTQGREFGPGTLSITEPRNCSQRRENPILKG